MALAHHPCAHIVASVGELREQTTITVVVVTLHLDHLRLQRCLQRIA